MKTISNLLRSMLLVLAVMCFFVLPQTASAQKGNKVPVVLTLAKGNKLMEISKAVKGTPLKANQTRAFLTTQGGKLKIEFPGWINDTLLYVVAPKAITLDMGLKNSLGLTNNENVGIKAGKVAFKAKGATDLPTTVALKEE